MSGQQRERVITRRAVIEGLPAFWRKVYLENGGGSEEHKQSVRACLAELEALDLKTVSREVVDEVIARHSSSTGYTEVLCNQCGRDVDATIIVGESSDTDSRTASVCLSCLRDSLAAFNEVLRRCADDCWWRDWPACPKHRPRSSAVLFYGTTHVRITQWGRCSVGLYGDTLCGVPILGWVGSNEQMGIFGPDEGLSHPDWITCEWCRAVLPALGVCAAMMAAPRTGEAREP